MTTMHPSQVASRAARGTRGGTAMMPLDGLMVRPFPEPGSAIQAAMEQLQQATVEPPEDEESLRELAQMPRPWDPATCSDVMRTQLWAWLGTVAMWVNEQHLWNVTRTGIPECWPAHPHLVHDLAVLACSRYYTSFAVTPAALEDWHRYALPGFLERLRDRLGDGCQPGKHQPRPRNERDETHASPSACRGRKQRYLDDVKSAGELAAAATRSEPTTPAHDDLHERW